MPLLLTEPNAAAGLDTFLGRAAELQDGSVRILASDSPRLDELRAILADIVEDDRRAGEIVRRLQALVGEMETALQPIDGAALHITLPAADGRPPTHTP